MIKDWPITNIGDLTTVYNAQVAGRVPHCSVVLPGEFATDYHTVISTGRNNYRAQVFCTNYGYRITDTVYGFTKELHR
jgi:hypothetical protein